MKLLLGNVFKKELISKILNFILYSLLQNDLIEMEDFTFEKFYRIYQSICPRNDIDHLFQEM